MRGVGTVEKKVAAKVAVMVVRTVDYSVVLGASKDERSAA